METKQREHTATALMQALNDYARAASDEAAKARKARNQLVRELYEDGVSVASMADLLGFTPKAIYKIIEQGGQA